MFLNLIKSARLIFNISLRHSTAVFSTVPVCIAPASVWMCDCSKAPTVSPVSSCDRARRIRQPGRQPCVWGSSGPVCPPASQRPASAAETAALWGEDTHTLPYQEHFRDISLTRTLSLYLLMRDTIVVKSSS